MSWLCNCAIRATAFHSNKLSQSALTYISYSLLTLSALFAGPCAQANFEHGFYSNNFSQNVVLSLCTFPAHFAGPAHVPGLLCLSSRKAGTRGKAERPGDFAGLMKAAGQRLGLVH
eukprot:scaffold134604_cov18-Tisochrysis_lutea.AAC.3